MTGPSPSRRTFLAGVGSLALAAGGPSIRATTGQDEAASRATVRDRSVADGDALEAFVDDCMAARVGEATPGAAVAVVADGDLALAKGYGVGDAETEAPVHAAETTFRIGSVGKLLTWTAVMACVEDGLVALDDPVDEYLTDSPVSVPGEDDDPVTLRHLATHTAGFAPRLDPGVVDDPAAVTDLETALVENRPAQVRPPGEAVGYSNYGAMLAGHVVAEARGVPFEAAVRETVLDPLGMDHTTFAQPVPADYPGTVASPHERDGDGFAVADPVYINWRPAGSTTATPTDIAAFARAHLGDGAAAGGRILRPGSVQAMHDTQFVRHPAVNNWRFGWYEYGPPGAGLIAHSGGTVHFRSLLVLAPAHDAAVFVVENTRDGGPRPSAVVDAILEEFGLVPDPDTPAATTDARARARVERVAGEYRSTMFPSDGPAAVAEVASRLSVSTGDGAGLVTETLEGDRRTWVETEPYAYRERGGHDVLAFGVADGAVEALHVSSEPQGTYRPVPAHERRAVTGGVLGASLAGFGGSLLGWGGRGLWRRWNRRGGDAAECENDRPRGRTTRDADSDGRAEGER